MVSPSRFVDNGALYHAALSLSRTEKSLPTSKEPLDEPAILRYFYPSMNTSKKHIIVGISGGVDSSVAALLLKQAGHHVEGLFMKNWEEEPGQEGNCSAEQDLVDAQAVCLKLGIRLHTVNFSQDYWDRVFSLFLEEYSAGRTPNPDVLCNKEIKFKAFLDYALSLGADCIATGHYVQCRENHHNRQLLKGLDSNKDQSYFLHLLNQAQLEKSLFPIGHLKKPAVRALAKTHQFRNSEKKDSTGICFIGERKFKTFLEHYLPAQPGEIQTPEGEVIGTHHGLMYYTFGQRQGLGIGGLHNKSDAPWYVAEKNIADNQLIVVQGHDHPLLFKADLTANNPHWISPTPPTLPLRCHAKIRYRQTEQPCQVIQLENNTIAVHFDQPQRAVTPGQSVVFYAGDICLGGAVIN
jgi:tRNA-uridine 2-sulfurtransferase